MSLSNSIKMILYKNALIFCLAFFGLTYPILAQPKGEKLVFPSPQAAQLGKFGGHNINYSSGTPNVNIPIYSAKEGSIEVPIALAYHYTGFKPSDVPGWCGIGWSLAGEGVISRTVKGRRDELNNIGYIAKGAAIRDMVDNGVTLTAYQNLNIIENGNDNFPDQFSFQFMGHSGKFVFDENGNPQVLSDQKIKITYVKGTETVYNEVNSIISWNIIAEDGTSYTFGKYDLSSTGDSGNTWDTSSWHLTEIINTKGDKVTFQYSSIDTSKKRLQLGRQEKNVINLGSGWNQGIVNLTSNASYEVYLEKIIASSWEIVFNSSWSTKVMSTSEVSSARTLNSIQINSLASGNTLIKQFSFTYDANMRLLTMGEDGSPFYEMEYHGTIPNIDGYTSQVDYWGYYNGQTNTSLIPGDYTNDLEPRTDLAKIGALTKITYPTKGYSTFEYEQNDYSRLRTTAISKSKIVVEDFVYSWQRSSGGMTTGANPSFNISGPTRVDVKFYVLPNNTVSVCNSLNGQTISLMLSAGTYTGENLLGNNAFYPCNQNLNTIGFYIGLSVKVFRETTANTANYGGVRVSSTNDYPASGATPVTKVFSYKDVDNGNLSSGVIANEPVYTLDVAGLMGSTNNFKIYSSTPFNPVSIGTHYYKDVKETNADHTSQHLFSWHQDFIDIPGKYAFVNAKNGLNGDIAISGTPYMELGAFQGYDYMRSLPKKVTTKDLSGNLKQEINYGYTNSDRVSVAALHHEYITAYTTEYTANPPSIPWKLYYTKALYIAGGWQRKTSETITTYGTDGSSSSTTTNYEYNNGEHLQLTRQRTSQSDGAVQETNFKYPLDYKNTPGKAGFIQSMIDANMVNYPLEKVVYLEKVQNDRKVIDANLTLYKSYNFPQNTIKPNLILPYKSFKFKGFNGVFGGGFDYYPGVSEEDATPAYSEEFKYTNYDKQGNPLGILIKNLDKVSYVWGYKGQYPIAEIQNADYDALNSALSSAGTSFDGMSGSSNSGDMRNKINGVRNNLTSALVTGYTYNPLIGVESVTDPSGKITWYNYDGLERLTDIREDHGGGNLIKSFHYNYADGGGFSGPGISGSPAVSSPSTLGLITSGEQCTTPATLSITASPSEVCATQFSTFSLASGSTCPNGTIKWVRDGNEFLTGVSTFTTYTPGSFTATCTIGSCTSAPQAPITLTQKSGCDTNPVCPNPRTPENPSNTIAGLTYKYYEAQDVLWCYTSILSTLSPKKTGTVSNFSFSNKDRLWELGFEFAGYLDVPADGMYTFYLNSDDASAFYVGNQAVVTYEGCHGTEAEQSGTICLKAGKHAIRTLVTQGGGGYGLTVKWSGPGISKEDIPDGRLFSSGVPSCAVNKVRLYFRPDGGNDRLLGAAIWGSNNGSSWTQLYSIGVPAISGSWQEFSFPNTTAYSSVRFTAGNNGYGELMELEFYNGSTKLTGTYFGNPTDVYQGNSSLSSTNVFDGNLNAMWHGANPGPGNYVGLNLTGCGNNPCSVPTLSINQPSSSEVCSTQPVTLTLGQSCSETVKWLKDGVEVASGINTTYSTNLPGTYTATCTVGTCTSTPQTSVTLTQKSGCDTNPVCSNPRIPENPSNTTAGLTYKYYEGVTNPCTTGSLTGMTAKRSGSVSNFTAPAADPGTTENFGFEFSGFLDVPTTGEYTFYLNSDDAGAVYIGTQLVVAYDGCHGLEVQQSATICLAAGKHAIKALLTQGGSGYGISVKWSGPSLSKQDIPNERLSTTGGTSSNCTVPGNNVTVKRWNGIEGNGIAGLVANTNNFTTTPSSTTTITSLETGTNQGENYGQLVQGYITAPQTGNYTFWIASDDNSELYLSNTNDPGSKVLIASVGGSMPPRQWAGGSSQSGSILLTACVQYYFEVRHKEGVGGDNLAVGWAKPGQDQNSPSEVVPGSVLSPYQGSSGNSCTGTGTGLRGTYYNSTNLAVPVGLVRVDPTIDFNWPNSPGPGVNENFSTRWEGQIEAPETGSYTFKINNDDGTKVWIGNMSQTLIDDWSDHGAREITSGVIQLTACQKYDIKIEFYDIAGGAQAQLFWTYGSQGYQIVPQSRLYPASGGGCTTPSSPVLDANPSSINSGSASHLTAVCANGVATWSDQVTGNRDVSPASTTTYTATCSVDGCTSTSSSVTVTVTNPPSSSDCYEIYNASHGRRLTNNGGIVEMKDADGSNSQIWKIENVSGYIKIRSMGGTNTTNVNNILGVRNQGSLESDIIDLQPDVNGDHQLWLKQELGANTGLYKLERKNTSYRVSSFAYGAGNYGDGISDLTLASDVNNDFGGNKWLFSGKSCPSVSQCNTTVVNATQARDSRIFSLDGLTYSNYGYATELPINAWSYDGGDHQANQRSFLDFSELHNIPQGATINSATLSLFGIPVQDAYWAAGNYDNGGSNQLWVQRVTSSWQENMVNWENRPAVTYVSQVGIPASTSQWNEDVVVSVTQLVQDMIALPPSERNGFQLILQTEQFYRARLFGSNESTDPSNRPKLQISYQYCPEN